MYAKLQNGFLRSAPKTVQWQGHTVNNPSADKLAELGYKPVVYTDMPTDAPSGQHYESGWKEGDKIVRGHLRTTQSIQNRSCLQKKHLI